MGAYKALGCNAISPRAWHIFLHLTQKVHGLSCLAKR
jgi:hypothetical protein